MSAREKPVLEMAPPYDDRLIQRVEEGFSELLQFNVQFEVVDAPGLLSGFIAYVDGTVYDMSGRTLLRNIQKHLLDAVLVSAPEAEKEGDET